MMTRMISFARLGLAGGLGPASLLALMLVGCGSEPAEVSLPKAPLHPVKGKVLLADGKPLTEGTVTFAPVQADGRPAVGKIQPDGSFTLSTASVGEGAAEGEYYVFFESSLKQAGPKAGTSKMVVPLEYTAEGATLKATVKTGSNDLPPFKLIPGAAKKKASR